MVLAALSNADTCTSRSCRPSLTMTKSLNCSTLSCLHCR